MPRRIVTLSLVVAIALGGMASAACASAHCARMSRMRCCPVDGLRAARTCCGGSIAPAAPLAAAALERAPQTPSLAALPALLPPATASMPTRVVAPIRRGGIGPPTSLVGHRTSLLL